MLLEIGFLVVILVILAVAIVTFPKIGQPIELVKIIVRLKKKILTLYAVVITIKTEDYFSPKVIKNIAKLKRVMQNILVKTLVINNINQEDLGGNTLKSSINILAFRKHLYNYHCYFYQDHCHY